VALEAEQSSKPYKGSTDCFKRQSVLPVSFPRRFHDVRDTFATNLVLGGVDLVAVKDLMGHADVTTTMRYAHPTPETKRNAVNVLLSQKQGGRLVGR